jgi:peptide/nickel transport system substrate-binding protein
MDRDDLSQTWARQRLSRRRVLRGSALGVVSLGLAGCATSSAPAAPTTAPTAAAPTATAASGAAPAPAATAQPKRGGKIMTMATSVERNLEPHISGSISGTGSFGPQVCYSTLLTYKWGPDVKPPSYTATGDVAESWTQPDELTYIFKLRPGVKFHNIAPVNGRELVAEDIVYSYQRVIEKKSLANYLSSIAKMETPDKSTFKITLDKPNADMLDNLAVMYLNIIPKERDQMNGGNMDGPPLIGTGPWIFESWSPSTGFFANRNPDYHLKGLPYTDRFESLRVTDPSLYLSSFRAGSTNMLGSGVSAQTAADIQKAVPSAVVLYIPSDRGTAQLYFNLTLDMFKDIRVRQAIHKAIDRKAIIETVWLGRARNTAGISVPDPSYLLPQDEVDRLSARDLAGAKQLLQQAGVTNLSFEIVCPTYLSGSFVTASEVIQANLKEVGINVTIKSVDGATFIAAVQSGNYQAACATYGGAAPNGWLNTQYKTGGGQNYAKYSDPEMDKMIDQQAPLAKDPEARKKILLDIQRKVINDAAYIQLLLYDLPMVHVAEMRGMYSPNLPNYHNVLWAGLWLDK